MRADSNQIIETCQDIAIKSAIYRIYYRSKVAIPVSLHALDQLVVMITALSSRKKSRIDFLLSFLCLLTVDKLSVLDKMTLARENN